MTYSSNEIYGSRTKTSQKRQRTSSSTTDEKTLTAKLMDLDVLDCSVCFDTLTTPIFQCENGHMACSTCCEKLTTICATCKLPTRSRNRGMESVIEQRKVQCPNAKFGCSEDVPYGERSTHLEQCAFTPCFCPFKSCNFSGSYKDLYKHSLLAKHRNSLCMFECGNPVFMYPQNGERVVLKEQTTKGSREGGELVVVECFDIPLGRIISVSCIAPKFPIRIGNFSYILKLNSSCGERLSYESKVNKVREVNGALPDKHFMLIPSYICPDYKLTICINRRTLLGS